MIRPYTAETIICSLYESYTMLYAKYGTRPNRFLISREYMTLLERESAVELKYPVSADRFEIWIRGVKVIVVEESYTAKAAIVLEE